MSEQSLKLGFIMGLLCPSEKRVGEEPIGYLYGHVAKEGEEPAVGTNRYVVNGVEYIGAIVPKPPVWDTGTFHHTCMFPTRNFISGALLGYTMVFTGEPLFVRYLNGDGHDVLCGDDDGTPYQLFRYVLSSGEWWDADSSGDTDTLSPNASMGVPCWTNYDIVNKDDNSVFLAASDCVCIPIYGEPVAYSYNGIVLPKLPEWDIKEYPYAIIYHAYIGISRVFLSKTPWAGTGEPYVWGVDAVAYGEKIVNASRGFEYTGKDNPPGWEVSSNGNLIDSPTLGQLQDTNGDGIADSGVYCAFWSNHDIISADGKTVLIAKSDPIPIYD